MKYQFRAQTKKLPDTVTGTSCGGLRSALLNDLSGTAAKYELQVLGLLGKLFTGPWMTQFYTAAGEGVNHVEAISTVREVII